MKNSKGETLPQPYLALAEMRRAQDGRFPKAQNLSNAFTWHETKERILFWGELDNGGLPEIPAASLSELEVWQANKLEENVIKIMDTLPEPALDYKAMYEELKNDYNILNSRYQIATMSQKSDPTPTRNWVAECAMALAASLSEEAAWDYAEAWAAEGKKRGHIH